MDLDVLSYFIAVAEEGNMTHAADRLHISQSAMSVAIGKLEKELGAALFERKSKNLLLTKDGEFFLSWALRIDRAMNEGKQHMNELVSTMGKIRIGNCVENDSIYHLISAFCKQYPSIEVHLYDKEAGWNDFQASKLDFLIVPETETQGLPRIRVAGCNNIYVLMGSGHHLADKSTICLDELSGERFAFSATDNGKMDPLYHYCIRSGLTPQVSFLCDGIECVLDLIAQTGVITLAYNTFRHFRQSIDGITAIPLSKGLEHTEGVFMVWEDEQISPIAAVFKQFAHNYFSKRYRR